MKTKVYVMIGIPGSGKSTWIKNNLKNIDIVSRDIIRENLGLCSSDEKIVGTPKQESKVTEIEYSMMRDLLNKHKSFVIDDTNVSKYTYSLIEFLKSNNAYIIGININTPLSICKNRRKNQIPGNILDNMYKSMQNIDKKLFDEYHVISGSINFKQKSYTFNSRKILYIHGYNSCGHDDIYKFLNKYLGNSYQIDTFDHSNDPNETMSMLNNINIKQYQLIIGHSLGGLFALTCQFKEIPIILINPGFGISYKYSEYIELENSIKNIQHNNVYGIFGTQDKHLDIILNNFKNLFKPNPNIQFFPGNHVPGEKDFIDNIIPFIKKILE